jgi:ABC-type ATPase with predicted acetyltransferase domain
MIVNIDQSIPHDDEYAAERTRGLYNVVPEDASRFRLDVDVPIERDDWQIGVVVGPSGSGKTSIARALHEHQWYEWNPTGAWSPDRAIISELTDASGEYEKACAALAAVGLGSVPSWIRPRRVLSNGEGFRADLAMLLQMSASGDIGECYIDEFTSVLDRQVAQVGSAAFAKAWRRVAGRRIILITPHYDILDWIEPDWWIDTAEGADMFGEDRGVVPARKGAFHEARHHGGYSGDRVATLEC